MKFLTKLTLGLVFLSALALATPAEAHDWGGCYHGGYYRSGCYRPSWGGCYGRVVYYGGRCYAPSHSRCYGPSVRVYRSGCYRGWHCW